MDLERKLRLVGLGGLFAFAALVMVMLFSPTDDPWEPLARAYLALFLVPIALGMSVLGVAVLRRRPWSEVGALVLLAIAAFFLAATSSGVERWLVVSGALLASVPLVLLAGTRRADERAV